jgi:hypothetical protein
MLNIRSYFQLSEKKKKVRQTAIRGGIPRVKVLETELTMSLHLHLHFVVLQLLVYPAFLLTLTDNSCSCEHKYVQGSHHDDPCLKSLTKVFTLLFLMLVVYAPAALLADISLLL